VLELAVATAVTYFLAARLGFALLTQPEDVAVFWPASGFAVGILIALGPNARPAVGLAVMVASFAASFTASRSFWSAVAFGVCDTGQVLFAAWLIERQFGAAFTLDNVRHVFGLLAAACVATAIAATVATFTISVLGPFSTPLPLVWRGWFTSDVLGIVTVAPLVIGLIRSVHDLPKTPELVEGFLAVVVLAAASGAGFGSSTENWVTIFPLALLLPLLVWQAARCRPVFVAAAVCVLAITIVWTITFGAGRLGDPSVPPANRVNAAQAAILAMTICSLVLAALFAERRQHEAALEKGNARLQEALTIGGVMAFEWDPRTRVSQRSTNAVQILGYEPQETVTATRFLAQIHPEDRLDVKAHLNGVRPDNPVYAVSFRFIRPDGQQLWLEETARGEFDAKGMLLRIKGLTRDITERKNTELALAERTLQLELAERAARVGSFAYDTDTERMQISAGYAAIHGFPDGTTEITHSEWQGSVHPDDVPGLEELRGRAFRNRSDEYSADYRIVRRGGELRWIDARIFVFYRNDDCPQRVVGVNIDVTDRKRAEKHLRAMNAELDHRVKNVLATVGAMIAQTQGASSSHADFLAGLDRRITSLARTHELLSHSNWSGVQLAEIVRCELAPYVANNSEVDGPSVLLNAEATQAVAMVLHELGTNAAKYGAFSNCNGRVLIRWWWLQIESQTRLAIEWTERGGPPVVAPCSSGYGTSIIRELIPFELGGAVDLVFAADGVRCRMELPASWIGMTAMMSNTSLVTSDQIQAFTAELGQ
jgi:PAS domain S-box-containing protein